MMIEWRCSCGLKLRAEDRDAGKQTQCPKCSQPLVVPAPAEQPAAAAGIPIGGPGVATAPYAYAPPAEPTWFACWMGEIGRRIRRYRALLIAAGLLGGVFLLWYLPRVKLAKMEKAVQWRFGGPHLHSLEVRKPYFMLTLPDELDVEAVRQVRYGSATTGVRYQYYPMHGKYTWGSSVLTLSGKHKEMTITADTREGSTFLITDDEVKEVIKWRKVVTLRSIGAEPQAKAKNILPAQKMAAAIRAIGWTESNGDSLSMKTPWGNVGEDGLLDWGSMLKKEDVQALRAIGVSRAKFVESMKAMFEGTRRSKYGYRVADCLAKMRP